MKTASILLVLASLSTAHAAEPTGTLTLACEGTVTDNWQADQKPEPISTGITIDFTARTVQGFGSYWPIPIPIDTLTETNVMFRDFHQTGPQEAFISGRLIASPAIRRCGVRQRSEDRESYWFRSTRSNASQRNGCSRARERVTLQDEIPADL
jgi:hypothetical protein